MSALRISRAAREEVLAALAAQFNTLLASACDEYDISDEVFAVNYDDKSNLFFGPLTFSDLKEHVGKLGSVQTISTPSANDEHEQIGFGVAFSGYVTVRIETFLSWPATTAQPPDLETKCDAVEAALSGALIALNPKQGATEFERTDPVYDTSIWYRSVVFTAEFSVTT